MVGPILDSNAEAGHVRCQVDPTSPSSQWHSGVRACSASQVPTHPAAEDGKERGGHACGHAEIRQSTLSLESLYCSESLVDGMNAKSRQSNFK